MKHDHIFGWSSPELQGKLLEFILDAMIPKSRVVMAEVGVYLGRGTAIFDNVFVSRGQDYKMEAIDHFEGSSEHKEGNVIPSYDLALQNLAPILDKVTLINSHSIAASKKFKQNHFDIVYIDASHEYDNVLADIKAWFPKVKKGGFICGDDFSSDWPGVVRAVNEHFEGKHNVVPGTQQWYFRK